MKIQILCTLGPRSLDGDVITGLDAQGVDLFRINLSHTPLDAVESAICLVRRYSSTPICLDTEGAQVRCGPMEDGVVLERGERMELTAEDVVGTARRLTLWPSSIFPALEVGSVLSIDFDGAFVKVTDVTGDAAAAEVVRSGRVRSNKAVTAHPPVELPPLSEKDLAAAAIGARRGVMHYALSFASAAEHVGHLRTLAPPGSQVIAKIESRAGVRNMDDIIYAADAVLIDRGDLSREIPIEHVPYFQKAIVRRANRWNRPAYVATNLLESMVTNGVPTIAESNDIANTLIDGVHGLVLAAETAIGVDPVGVIAMVRRAISAFEQETATHLFDEEARALEAVA